MICIGMSKETLQKYKQYDSIFSVYVDLEHFYQKAYDPTTTILIITDEFINKYIGWDKLDTTINLVLTTNPKLSIVLLGEHIKYDLSNVYLLKVPWDRPGHISNTISKIYTYQKSLLNNKNSRVLRDFRLNAQHLDDLVMYFLTNKELAMQFLHTLLDSYEADALSKWSSENLIANLKLENTTLLKKLKAEADKTNQLQLAYNNLSCKYKDLIDKINYQYCIPYEEYGNEPLQEQSLNYSKILYIKEISHVKYTQSLVYYLQNILNSVTGCHTRSVIIETQHAYKRVALYPDYRPHYNLTVSALQNDDIVMVGYQRDIMTSILQNVAQNRYLIIWDRTGADSLYVTNADVKPLYTFSDINDNCCYNYPLANILSYSTETKHIPFIKNFENMSINERMHAYSSLPIINELIKALEV